MNLIESDGHEMCGLNALPVWDDVRIDRFVCDNPRDFIQIGRDINRLLLMRALAIRNIRTETWRIEDNPISRWAALGAGEMLRFRASMPYLTSAATHRLVDDKERTKVRLKAHGVPVPEGRTVDATDIQGALDWLRASGAAKVVLKPRAGTSRGRGVVSGIRTEEELAEAMSVTSARQVVLEHHIDGADHRLLVIGGKYTAGIRRHPAFVIGDGVSTIRSLVEAKNKQRAGIPLLHTSRLVLSREALNRLAGKGLTPDSVPDDGVKVQLQTIANISAGGDSETITRIHPDFMGIAERCWHAFADLAFCGVDLIAEDITKPAAEQPHAVIEINANPGLALHHFPSYGLALDAAGAVADYLFPDEPMVGPVAVRVVMGGRVQRVGLRAWIKKAAIQYGVTGYCENQPDGTVLALFEGSPVSVESMLRMCAIGTPKSIVSAMQYRHLTCVGHHGFDVGQE